MMFINYNTTHKFETKTFHDGEIETERWRVRAVRQRRDSNFWVSGHSLTHSLLLDSNFWVRERGYEEWDSERGSRQRASKVKTMSFAHIYIYIYYKNFGWFKVNFGLILPLLANLCREFNQNPNLWETKQIEKNKRQRKQSHAQDNIYVIRQFAYIHGVAGISL